MPSPQNTPATPGCRRDQNSTPSAVRAMANRSQLINAAAATQGEAASIIASHGRCGTDRTCAHTAISRQAPSSTTLTSKKVSVASTRC